MSPWDVPKGFERKACRVRMTSTVTADTRKRRETVLRIVDEEIRPSDKGDGGESPSPVVIPLRHKVFSRRIDVASQIDIFAESKEGSICPPGFSVNITPIVSER
jgi:hypothetical protein